MLGFELTQLDYRDDRGSAERKKFASLPTAPEMAKVHVFLGHGVVADDAANQHVGDFPVKGVQG